MTLASRSSPPEPIATGPIHSTAGRAEGSAYTLQGFHDAFAQQGWLPLKLMREVLLPGDRRPTP